AGRLRLRRRVPGGADDARRQDHADLRGHERDPAARDRPGDGGAKRPPTVRRILIAPAAALAVGLGAVSLAFGFSASFPVRLLQGLFVVGMGAVVLFGGVAFITTRMAGWRSPASEEEFERIVERAERLAAEDRWGEADEDLEGE